MTKVSPWDSLQRGHKTLYSAESRHGLWFAVDTDGKPMLLITHSGPAPTRSSLPELKGVEVFSHSGDGRTPSRLGIRLRNAEHRDLFERLCRDVADASTRAETEAGAVSIFLNRMHRWYALLRRGSDRLSKAEQKGLFGELYFLETVSLDILPPLFAVQTWQGPEGEPKDFAFGAFGVECKAKSASGRDSIRISSEHQLDLEGLDELYLFVLDLAPTPAGEPDGMTLKGLVRRVQSILAPQDQAAVDAFDRQLESLGYRDEDDYTEYTWLTQRSRQFQVGDGFPCITPSSLTAGVSNVEYQVDLMRCGPWLQDPYVMRKVLGGETLL